MPLLPTVGRRNPRVRAVVTAVYGLLIVGGITMVIPFMITLTCSVSNRYDLEKYHPIPVYLWDNDELYCKFLFEKYTDFADLRRINDLVHLTTEREMRMADDVVENFFPTVVRYRKGADVPNLPSIRADYDEFLVNYPRDRLTENFTNLIIEHYRKWLKKRYLDLAAKEGLLEGAKNPEEVALQLMNRMNGEVVATEFALVDFPPRVGRGPKAFLEETQVVRDYRAFLAQAAPMWKRPEDLDTLYEGFARTKYVTVARLNQAWGTEYEDFVQVEFPVGTPEDPARAADREEFLRDEFPLRWISVPESYAAPFRQWLLRKMGTLRKINLELMTDYATLEDVPFTTAYSGSRPYRRMWGEFVLEKVPLADRAFSGFEIDYANYLRKKYGEAREVAAAYGMPVPSIDSFRVPFDWLDFDSFHRERGYWRGFFLVHNFAVVFEFLSTRGRAVWNTFILVLLTVAAGLTINPIAAYALSRFNLRGTQKILIFLLIPMSFPPEVSMIPSFLLLRSFPLGLLITGAAVAVGVFFLFRRFAPAWNQGWRSWAVVGVAFVAGRFTALPLCSLLHIPPSMTLLNTYAALVLPGMASGFSIFLLKGFFDGLPRELYEAASIDGASEMKMFRIITYPLCKPIIVVTLMGQVLGAYGSFMWAFVVCQERNMWTLMVWLYAFQTDYAEGQLNLIMAALTLASIPTFIFFIFCQKIILRGIILPSMK